MHARGVRKAGVEEGSLPGWRAQEEQYESVRRENVEQGEHKGGGRGKSARRSVQGGQDQEE